MEKIIKLPPHVVNLIAAGEVVERPASVLKELLENSIDAGSTHIKVYLEEHGTKLIEVIDNGHGITKDEAPLVFEQHATSKISRSADLQKISSFGFRGEAMASIRSVAEKVLLQSKTEENDSYAFIITPTTITEDTAKGNSKGTRVQIHNLFATVPARKKFLKSPNTELKHLTETFLHSALTNPVIHFELYHNNKQLKNFPAQTLNERVTTILGDTFTKNAYETDAIEHGELTLKAFLGNTNLGRKSSPTQYIFVNDRIITNKTIYSAIQRAYQGFLHRDLKPAYVLFLQASPHIVDVNVHPRKLEVRFNEPSEIFRFVHSVAKSTLTNEAKKDLVSDFGLSETTDTSPQSANKSTYKPNNTNGPVFKPRSNFAPKQSRVKQAIQFSQTILENEGLEQEAFPWEQQPSNDIQEQPSIDSSPKQIFNTYILLEQDDNLLIVDQHAAAEKIAFEKIMSQYEQPRSKPLLVPQIVELQKDELEMVLHKKETLANIGISIEAFGKQSIQVTEIPELSSSLDVEEYIEKVLEETDEFASSFEGYASQTTDPISQEEYYIIATTACHGSIRAGQPLSEDEMVHIIQDLFALETPKNCPHGRPTYYKLEKHEIEKFFKRII